MELSGVQPPLVGYWVRTSEACPWLPNHCLGLLSPAAEGTESTVGWSSHHLSASFCGPPHCGPPGCGCGQCKAAYLPPSRHTHTHTHTHTPVPTHMAAHFQSEASGTEAPKCCSHNAVFLTQIADEGLRKAACSSAKTCARAYPVREDDGLLFVWLDNSPEVILNTSPCSRFLVCFWFLDL